MNKLSTEDAVDLKEKLYQAIQKAPRRMKEDEIEEAVTMAYKQALGISVTVTLEKDYPSKDPKPIRVYAIGRDPEEAINNFFIDNQGAESVEVIEKLTEAREGYPWGFYINVDGTGCKVAGTYISGYAVLTWWK